VPFVVVRVAVAVLLVVGACVVGVLAWASIADPAYPQWRRFVQALVAAPAVLAFLVSAWRLKRRQPTVHLAAGGCVCTTGFAVAAFS